MAIPIWHAMFHKRLSAWLTISCLLAGCAGAETKATTTAAPSAMPEQTAAAGSTPTTQPVASAEPSPTPETAAVGAIDPIAQNAQQMLEQGRHTFRYDTFGDEAFWGGKLRLHEAIAGEKNGGVGPGLTPNMALSLAWPEGRYGRAASNSGGERAGRHR